MHPLLAASVESFLWTTALAWKVPIIGVLLVLLAIYHRADIAKIAAWGWALAGRLRPAPVTVAPITGVDDAAVLQAFNVLKARVKGSPEGAAKLKAIWPYLEPGEGG